MSVIAIPLGFQFLAVLGGKALMLAKLALILTSIQGLKKIATSNFSYGLYHSPGRCKLILNSYSTTPIKSLITNSVHKRCYYCQENVNKLIMSYCQVCQLNLAPFTFFLDHYDRRWQPPQPEAEQPGLFDAFDMSPESPALDAIRPRISFPERQAAMQ